MQWLMVKNGENEDLACVKWSRDWLYELATYSEGVQVNTSVLSALSAANNN